MSGLTASGPLGWGQCDELHLFKGYRVPQFVSSVVRKQFDGPLPLGDGGVEIVAPCEVAAIGTKAPMPFSRKPFSHESQNKSSVPKCLQQAPIHSCNIALVHSSTLIY